MTDLTKQNMDEAMKLERASLASGIPVIDQRPELRAATARNEARGDAA